MPNPAACARRCLQQCQWATETGLSQTLELRAAETKGSPWEGKRQTFHPDKGEKMSWPRRETKAPCSQQRQPYRGGRTYAEFNFFISVPTVSVGGGRA